MSNKLNLNTTNFNKNIDKKYICKNHNGLSIPPHIKWNSINNALSYILILEDPDAPRGNFIHWFIPFISPKINEINIKTNIYTYTNIYNKLNNINLDKINILQGYNSHNKIGYFGTCAPNNTGIHRYIFKLYAIDNILPNINKHLFINSSSSLEDLLKKYDIRILAKDSQTYLYKYGDTTITKKN